MILNSFKINSKGFGLDISDRSFKIANLKKRRSGFKLTSYETFEIEPGVIKKGELKNKRKLTSLLREEKKKIKMNEVVVALPEEKSFLKVIKTPKMPKKDLESAIIYKAEEYIPMNIEDAYVDFEIIKPAYSEEDHMHVLLAALPKKIVDPYFKAVKKAGLKPIAFEVESLSICRALMEKDKVIPPTLIIDFGLTKTSFIIYSGRSLRFTQTLPISSHQFTESIAEKMDLNLEKAEKIKKEFGIKTSSKKGKKIKKSIKEILDKLTKQTKEHIEFYSSYDFGEHFPPDMEKKIKKIILSGGGSNLKGLTGFLEERIKIPVKRGNPWINISKEPLLSKEKSILYTSVLGLALRNYIQSND
ncbi:MAG: type IV pilus assembly protein PilM [Minisyncoccales bacterium]